MKGDVGPYVDPVGPSIWVPRTVPYLEARRIASEALDYGQRLRYLGKRDALLLGFARGCRCEEACEAATRWDEERAENVPSADNACWVPAWAFESVER